MGCGGGVWVHILSGEKYPKEKKSLTNACKTNDDVDGFEISAGERHMNRKQEAGGVGGGGCIHPHLSPPVIY